MITERKAGDNFALFDHDFMPLLIKLAAADKNLTVDIGFSKHNDPAVAAFEARIEAAGHFAFHKAAIFFRKNMHHSPINFGWTIGGLLGRYKKFDQADFTEIALIKGFHLHLTQVQSKLHTGSDIGMDRDLMPTKADPYHCQTLDSTE